MTGSRTRAASRPVAAALLALVLAAVGGCDVSGPDRSAGRSAEAATGTPAVGAAATTTRGAELRAALTYLLTERVHLAVEHARTLQAAQGQRDAADVVAARRALVSSAEATVDVLGTSYSDAEPLLAPALRAHDAALLEHTEVLVAGADPTDALSRLDDRRDEVAVAVRQVVPRLRAQDVDAALATATSSTLDAVRAAVEGAPRAPALQRVAHEAAWSTARLLAVGVSVDRDLGLAGSPASELRGRLTGLLAEHVLLSAGLAARLAEAGGDVDDPQVGAATAVLDASAVSLAELFGRSAPETAAPVLLAWRDHLRELGDRARARATGRAPAAAAGPDYLVRLQAALGEQGEPRLPRVDEVGARAASSLRMAVDAAATRSRTAPEALHQAAADSVVPAAVLASAVAEQLQLS